MSREPLELRGLTQEYMTDTIIESFDQMSFYVEEHDLQEFKNELRRHAAFAVEEICEILEDQYAITIDFG